jgi:hypothetical protein
LSLACAANHMKSRWNARIAPSRSSSWTGADMDAHSNKLSIIINAPALVSGDERPLAIVHGMERALPGLRLGWTLSEKGGIVALPDRDEWVAVGRTSGGFPFVCNDDDNCPMTLFGLENPNGLYTGGGPHLEVHGSLHLDAVGIATAADVLKAIGEASRHTFCVGSGAACRHVAGRGGPTALPRCAGGGPWRHVPLAGGRLGGTPGRSRLGPDSRRGK